MILQFCDQILLFLAELELRSDSVDQTRHPRHFYLLLLLEPFVLGEHFICHLDNLQLQLGVFFLSLFQFFEIYTA